jgi:Fur family transcriptional regulator, peroxide stress response regulator
MAANATENMTANVEAIVRTLKEHGLRVTPQRFAVYSNLLGRQDHPTVDQMLLELNSQGPVSSQATIYSSLQALESAGLVRSVHLETGVGRYDANTAPHHHFCCHSCGAIEDIPWQAFANLDLSRVAFQAATYEVVVRGTCPACQEQPS